MKSRIFQEAMNDIDDDLIEAADVRVVPMKKKNMLKLVSGFAAACLAAVCVIAAVPKNNTGIFRASQASEPPAEAGGIDGKINIHKEIRAEGGAYAFSNEEGFAFLETVREGIRNELAPMGLDTGDFRITKCGYSHVRSGDAGNSIAVNWKDYLAYNGEEIAAIITVMKDENGFHYFPAWGSPSFADYGNFLAEHKGEELVYIWAGDVDAILTPDHQLYAFGHSLADAINEDEFDQYYSFFKRAQNTYIPE